MKLEGKIALITGGYLGAGRGIVDTFLKYGAKVIVLDYNSGVTSMNSANILAYNVDIRDASAISKALIDATKQYGKIDILVNNAGVCKLTPFRETTESIRDYHFDINIKGTWNVTKAIVPYMQKQNYGKIVNLSSVTGPMVADAGEVAYATTKAALIGFTKGLARELVDSNINVNAIMPGYIMTPMVDGIAKDSNASDPESVIKGIAAGIPMGRLGTIQELGELAAFLASDESSYITGQGIVIDGGSTLPETKAVGV